MRVQLSQPNTRPRSNGDSIRGWLRRAPEGIHAASWRAACLPRRIQAAGGNRPFRVFTSERGTGNDRAGRTDGRCGAHVWGWRGRSRNLWSAAVVTAATVRPVGQQANAAHGVRSRH